MLHKVQYLQQIHDACCRQCTEIEVLVVVQDLHKSSEYTQKDNWTITPKRMWTCEGQNLQQNCDACCQQCAQIEVLDVVWDLQKADLKALTRISTYSFKLGVEDRDTVSHHTIPFWKQAWTAAGVFHNLLSSRAIWPLYAPVSFIECKSNPH